MTEEARETAAAGNRPPSRARNSAYRADRTEKLNEIRQSRLSQVLYWRSFVNGGLMLSDAAIFIIAAATVLWLLNEQVPIAAGYIGETLYLLCCAALWVLCLQNSGVYHRHVMGDGMELTPRMLRAAAKGWLVMCAANFVLRLPISFKAVTLVIAAALVLNYIERVIVRTQVIGRGRGKGSYSYSTVLVGSPQGIGRTLKFLAKREQLNYKPVAVCPIRKDAQSGLIESVADSEEMDQIVFKDWGTRLKVLPYDNKLGEAAVRAEAQTVMVCDVLRRDSDNFNAFAISMESLGMEIACIASSTDISTHEIVIRPIQGVNVMTISLPQYGVAASMGKRAFDLVMSTLAIIVSSPIMAAVAIAIKIEDHGPVFYTQERIGLRGKPFRMIKFRSMRVNADKMDKQLAEANGQQYGALFKLKDDPRVTKVGKFIRKTSLDEFPQFFNVFIGNMSMVGPRPQRQYEVDQYNEIYSTRLLVKPGVTGPWQVSGRNDLSQEESQQLDVAYVQNWSILGDVIYIFRTVGVIFSHKGAY
jgi:exopolysaccharide biosynthesis polyprenyl glycosylphosphotransferase